LKVDVKTKMFRQIKDFQVDIAEAEKVHDEKLLVMPYGHTIYRTELN